MNWSDAVAGLKQAGEGFVLVTIVGATGSTPRDGGSKMVVTEEDAHDTIGGGQLEFKIVATSRKLLSDGVSLQKIEHFPLATKADQCCGGSVTVLFEVFPVARIDLMIFGAGHVARALVQVLAACDTRITWVDNREEMFPEEIPGNVTAKFAPNPEELALQCTPGTRVLILTHDHSLDYRLLARLLDETEVGYIGLIGSATKARRFYQRLLSDGFPDDISDRYHCPVGLDDVKGKLPMEVAISIAAQVLSLDPPPDKVKQHGVSWRDIRRALQSRS